MRKDAAANWEYPLQDGLGSVRAVASTILETRSYDPYGTTFGATGTSQTPYGFTGEPAEERLMILGVSLSSSFAKAGSGS